jgi:2-polyprenyl-3-methyl-5-hydroxy-6-metoxy-1,4-benzoquinol methylase
MLADRALTDELMDAEDLDPATYAAVLADLASVNTLTMARRPTLAFLSRLIARHGAAGRPLNILDVGFGDGDMLRAIHRWGARRRVALTLVGIDLNPNSAPAARARTPGHMAIDYRTGDYAGLAGQDWDVVLSSLVAHHMTRPQLTAFLRFIAAEARCGWFINDLHRHGFAWLAFPLLATLARWHPIVRHDGQLSIARAYRPREWLPILAEAGVTGASVFRAFPFRLCVEAIR